MAAEQMLAVALDEDTRMVVVADQFGPALVSARGVDAQFEHVTASIEKVSTQVLAAVRKAAPTSATVELGFSLAMEEGRLVALFGKVKGEASITVTLEWSASAAAGG